MRVRIVYFGVLKDLFPVGREVLEVGDGETVGGLLRLLQERASKQSEIWKALAVAVNDGYVKQSTLLCEGDEVALLPPVSGGREEGLG